MEANRAFADTEVTTRATLNQGPSPGDQRNTVDAAQRQDLARAAISLRPLAERLRSTPQMAPSRRLAAHHSGTRQYRVSDLTVAVVLGDRVENSSSSGASTQDIQRLAAKSWPYMMGYGLFLSVLPTVSAWYASADPTHGPLHLPALWLGIVTGLLYNLVGPPPDLGIDFGNWPLRRQPGSPLRYACIAGLRSFGRRWVWSGVLVPGCGLLLATHWLPRYPLIAPVDSSSLDAIAGALFLASLEWCAVFLLGWGLQALSIAMARGDGGPTKSRPIRKLGRRERARLLGKQHHREAR